MGRARQLLLALAVAGGVAASSGQAAADSVDACMKASFDGQTAKNAGRLAEAMRHLERCAESSCPAVLRDDCVKFLEEVRAVTPTVVLSATDADGRDVLDAQVTVDDKAPFELDGKEMPLDPGRHEITFVRPSGATVKVPLLARVGDKGRPVVAQFASPTAPLRPPPPSGSDAPDGRSIVLPLTLGAVAAAGLGLAAYFQLSGAADVRSLRARCGAQCPRDDVDELDRVRGQKEWGARIAGGVGLVAAGVAIYLLVRPSDPPRSSAQARSRLGVDVGPGGAPGATFTTRF